MATNRESCIVKAVLLDTKLIASEKLFESQTSDLKNQIEELICEKNQTAGQMKLMENDMKLTVASRDSLVAECSKSDYTIQVSF